MGRASFVSGIIFAVLGFIAGVYALSFGATPDLPTPLLLLLCPAALLGGLFSTSGTDSDVMWLLIFFNTIIYGAVGAYLGQLFHVDRE
ncbi:MAG TPA: hypothetical protein VMX38_05440 [Verrucomicrobiae bacterium]|nr:hypothetical protein [Verrucomicrobiae bacterium]